MNLATLEAALWAKPFRPFELRTDGEVIRINHSEQVFLAEKKTTVIADAGDRIHIMSLDRISKLALLRATRERAA